MDIVIITIMLLGVGFGSYLIGSGLGRSRGYSQGFESARAIFEKVTPKSKPAVTPPSAVPPMAVAALAKSVGKKPATKKTATKTAPARKKAPAKKKITEPKAHMGFGTPEDLGADGKVNS